MSNNQTCNRPGCSGIIDDNFCIECCKEPLTAAELMQATPSATAPAVKSTTTTSTQAEQIIQSIPPPVVVSPVVDTPIEIEIQLPVAPPVSEPKQVNALTLQAALTAGKPSTATTSLGSLGLGLVPMPQLPKRDLLSLIMDQPVVSVRERRCKERHCQAMTLLGTDLTTNRVYSFCNQCGRQYDFSPTLKAGEGLLKRYMVAGVVTYGGMGFIYGATDIQLARPLIIKGCRDAADAEAQLQSQREMQLMSKAKHPNIVNIYDVVRAEEEKSSNSTTYIVMEYIDGWTLQEMLEQYTVLPPEVALAYMIDVLPAVQYLHEKQGLVLCDFNPRNCMVERDRVVIIDFGAFKPVGVNDGEMSFSDGFAPIEVAKGIEQNGVVTSDLNPTFDKDLYAVGRTLAHLVSAAMDQYMFSLPDEHTEPVFAKHPALYRFLQKATHENPAQRFQSAEEMRTQMIGVLHQILASKDNACPFESGVFKTEQLSARASSLLDLPDASQLPKLKDGQGYVRSWQAGKSMLASGNAKAAEGEFRQLIADMPGELAPQLALAMALEKQGRHDQAASLYRTVAYTDPSFISACFGLGRCLRVLGDRDGAEEAYSLVPADSRHFISAQTAAVNSLLLGNTPVEKDLRSASEKTEVLLAISSGLEVHKLAADVLSAAIQFAKGNADLVSAFANVGKTSDAIKKAKAQLKKATKEVTQRRRANNKNASSASGLESGAATERSKLHDALRRVQLAEAEVQRVKDWERKAHERAEIDRAKKAEARLAQERLAQLRASQPEETPEVQNKPVEAAPPAPMPVAVPVPLSDEALEWTESVQVALRGYYHAKEIFDHAENTVLHIEKKAAEARSKASNANYELDNAQSRLKRAEKELAYAQEAHTKAVTRANELKVLGYPLKVADLRKGLEKELLECARFARTSADREAYIDLAHRARPLSII